MQKQVVGEIISRRRLLALGMKTGVATAAAASGALAYTHLLHAQVDSGQEPNIVLQWNTLILQAIRANPSLGPTIVARALAIVHTCMYEAWSIYTPRAKSGYAHAIPQRASSEWTDADKQEAISYAAYGALIDLFPGQQPLFQAQMAQLGYPVGTNQTLSVNTSPRRIGEVVARSVLAFRHRDGSNQLGDLHPGPYSDYTGYQPINLPGQPLQDPNRWQPLLVPDAQGHLTTQHFITPQWQHVIPFSMRQNQVMESIGRPFLATQPEFEQQARDLLAMSATLTDREKIIAEYWRDGAHTEQPPGHWCLFAQYVSQRDNHDLDKDVQLFFLLTNALLDASICCWKSKRSYDSVRPVTAIHYLFNGISVQAWAGPFQGTRWIDGAQWKPYQPLTVVTPSFPEFCSGHSTFSAAAAEVLRCFTGSDTFGASALIKSGSSFIESGLVPASDITLSWPTFSAAADQAGISRRYGGIHFQTGDLMGRALGRTVGRLVWEKAQEYLALT